MEARWASVAADCAGAEGVDDFFLDSPGRTESGSVRSVAIRLCWLASADELEKKPYLRGQWLSL